MSRSKVTRVVREEILRHCAGLPGGELSHPFGDETAVFKVGGKMYALMSLDDSPGQVTLKCDPEAAPGLRASYEAVRPGYHMNKRHWITIDLEGDVPDSLLTDLVADSYDLVVAALPARLQPPDLRH